MSIGILIQMKNGIHGAKKNPRKQARLDFFLITSHMVDIIHKANIRPGY